MSALTQEALRAVEVPMTPEEIEENRRWAERVLGREIAPRPASVAPVNDNQH